MKKNIRENFDGLFSEVKEGLIDSDNFTIHKVCLFGRRESLNGRTYSDTAIEAIARLSEGNKCYLNHISKQEMKDRSGVRDIRDFAGVFINSKRSGEKVFADLKVREQHWPLLKDIALMQPHGVGHSIDARIKVSQDDSGKESVQDVVRLNSVDLVASAATTDSLFEAYKACDDEDQSVEGALEAFCRTMGKIERTPLHVTKG